MHALAFVRSQCSTRVSWRRHPSPRNCAQGSSRCSRCQAINKRGGAALAAFLALAVVAVFGYQLLERNYTRPGPTTAPLRIEIPAGASVRAALARLTERGAITS